MKNNRGFVLIMTLIFTMVFTLVGFGMFYLVGLQNQHAEKMIASSQAFWLADGLVDRARSKVKANSNCDQPQPILHTKSGENVSISPAVNSETNACLRYSWIVNADATVGNQKRAILAKVSRYNVEDLITTHGTFCEETKKNGQDKCQTIIKDKKTGEVLYELDRELVSENAEFTFESVFNNISLDTMIAHADHVYTDGGQARGDIRDINQGKADIDGITYINLDGNQNLTFHPSKKVTEAWTGLLIVDVSEANKRGNFPTIKFTNKTKFNGILWVIGKMTVMGYEQTKISAQIRGAIFIDGSPDDDTSMGLKNKGGEPANIVYDTNAIDDTLALIDPYASEKARVVAWQEL